MVTRFNATFRRSAGHRRGARGFTMIELMVTLTVAGVLTALALPNLRPFIQSSRLTSASNDLLRSLYIARAEAVKRQRGNVVVCATADPTASDATITCSYGAFNGWFVFNDVNGNWQRDAGDAVIEKHALLDSSVSVRNDADGIVSYAPTGFANLAGAEAPSSNIILCDQRGTVLLSGTDSAARAVLIGNTGRVRVTKTQTEVATAIANTVAAACP
ncbi:MAG TPA: GspH/FimT family pseudopilin [Steroidobacteraceae bacterium]|nr:GspH/FimT family pseudopilin [Steroidobacteraceae bacterium]